MYIIGYNILIFSGRGNVLISITYRGVLTILVSVSHKQDPTTWGHRKSHTTTPPAGECSGPSWAPTTRHGPATSPSTTTQSTHRTESTHRDTVTCQSPEIHTAYRPGTFTRTTTTPTATLHTVRTDDDVAEHANQPPLYNIIII